MKTTTNLGLLVLRVGIGIMFIIFGWGKITGGPEMWKGLGSAMGALGITFAPVFWGFMAAFAEFAGGLALTLGLLVRPFAALLAFTMLVAALMLIGKGAELQKYAHAVNMCIVFSSLVILGPGRLAVGAMIKGLKGHWFQ